MSAYQLRLLGKFELRHNGQIVTTIHQPRLQSVLAYLAIHHNTPQSRLDIAHAFWPNTPNRRAFANLRKTVHRLRQALPDIDLFLDIDSRVIGWRFDESVTLDVANFEQVLAEIQAAQQAGQQAKRNQLLARAADLYQGELLPHCYDDWLLPIREKFHQQGVHALAQLAESHTQQRNYAEAIRIARRLLSHDPLREATYRQLMQLHLINADSTEALLVYHTCTATLRQALGVDPSPATQEIYERILARTETPFGLSIKTDQYVDRSPLVGRHIAWQQLLMAWQAANQSKRFVVISGEAGIGKTRLAEELLLQAEQQGFTTSRAQAYEATRNLSYAPLVTWLRSKALQQAQQQLDSVWLTEIARLLPELYTQQPNLPLPQSLAANWQRVRLFEAIAQLVFLAKQPSLLILDDLQWCDQETLEWLAYLFHTDQQARLLVVGTVRLEEAGADHPLTALLRGLSRADLVTEINLDPLDAAETAQLAQQSAAQILDSMTVAQLYQSTEGNPLFIVESVRAIYLATKSTSAIDSSLTLPPKVQTVIEARLDQVSPIARNVVSVAAVMGRDSTFVELAAAGPFDTETLINAIDEALQRGIFREQDRSRYDFSHGKIRDVAYARLSRARRRLLHLQVAEALERVYLSNLDEISGVLGEHYHQAGKLEKAQAYFSQAGDAALHIYAIAESIAAYRQALRLAQKKKSWDSGELTHLYTALSRALELDSNFEGAFANYEAMQDIAQQQGDSSLQLTALVGQITLLTTPTPLQNVSRGEAMATQALKLAHQLNDQAAEAKILWNLLLIHGFSNRISTSIAFGERALTLARQLDLQELSAFILNDLGFRGYQFSGQLIQARAVLVEACALWRSLNNLPMLTDSLSALCYVSIHLGQYDQAIAYSEEAHQISQSIGNLWGQSYSLYTIGWVHWEYGDPDRAIKVMQAGIRLGELAGFLGAQVMTRAFMGQVYAELGAFEQAVTIVDKALVIAQTQLPNARLSLRGNLAQIHLLQDDLVEAEAVIKQVKRDPSWNPLKNGSLGSPYWIHLAEAEIALKQGNFTQAMAIIEKWVNQSRRSEQRVFLAPSLYWQGRILQAMDKHSLAWESYQEARQAAERLGSCRMLWPILFALSQLEPDQTEAQHLHQQAKVIIEYIADHTTHEPALRNGFLNRPDVRAVLA